MSTYFHTKATAFCDDYGDLKTLIKIPADNLNKITLTFGARNSPGLDIDQMITLNPKLCFLITVTAEMDFVKTWIARFNWGTKTIDEVLLEDTWHVTKYNKKLREEYFASNPNDPKLHWNRMFWSHSSIYDALARKEDLKEMFLVETMKELENE